MKVLSGIYGLFLWGALAFAVSAHANAVNFDFVGTPGFASDLIEPRISVDGEGTPYVIYRTSGGYVNVQKFNGATSSWEAYGPQDQILFNKRFDAAVSLGGRVYIAVGEAGSVPLKLYKVTENEQKTLGFIPNSRDLPSVVVAPDGTPFISYQSESYQAEVSFFEGQGFVTAGSVALGNSGYTALTRSPNGDIYLAVGTFAGKAAKWNGSEWDFLDLEIQPGYTIKEVDIAVDASDQVYVSLKTSGDDILVSHYQQGDFVSIGQAFSGASVNIPHTLVVDGIGEAFVTANNGTTIEVWHQDGSGWNLILTGANHTYSPALAYATNGVMYLAYRNYSLGAAVERTDVQNSPGAVTDPETGKPLSEVDPIYSAEKASLLRIEDTEGWDKNAADDFDGNYYSLTNAPQYLSDFSSDLALSNFTNDLNLQSGQDGQDGLDGISPTATIDADGNVTITDINGTTNANVKGANGLDGQDGKSPQIAVENDALLITHTDGSNTSIDIGALITQKVNEAMQTTSSPPIWAVIGANGAFLSGQGIDPTSVVREARGIYRMCVAGAQLQSPLAINVTSHSGNASAGQLLAMSTSQVGQNSGCFKVFARGVTGGSEHWDVEFSVHVNGTAATTASANTDIEIASFTIAPDGLSIASSSGNVQPVVGTEVANTRVMIAWNMRGMFVASNSVLPTGDYYVESLTPNITTNAGGDMSTWFSYDFQGSARSTWAFSCFDENSGTRMHCDGVTLRLMRR